MNNKSIKLKYKPFKSYEEDYEFALIHLLLFKGANTKYQLLFGMIECYPQECSIASELPVLTDKFKGNARLFYLRKKIKASLALELYKKSEQNGILNIDWDNYNIQILKDFISVPIFPNLTLSKTDECPYIPQVWGAVRCHHLYSEIPDFLEDFLYHENVKEWVKYRLLWDLCKFHEQLGSLHLVLPNPLYRKMNMRLIPKNNNGNVESMSVSFIPRKNKDLKYLQFKCLEKTDMGFTGGHDIKINNNSFSLDFTGTADRCATLVCCPERGLLDYSPFQSFLRNISVSMNIIEEKRIVNVPALKDNISDTHTTDISKCVNEMILGDEDTPELELGKKINKIEYKRKQQQNADKLGQEFFRAGEMENAKKVIRKLISSARQRVTIIDPYFSTIELFDFALAVTNKDLEIKIYTGNEVLKKESTIEEYAKQDIPPPKAGIELLKQIKNIKKQDINIQINVMTGISIFHDRFLIIDEDVWFSGNSLNSIGKRGSMLIKLPDPEPILKELNSIPADKIQTLEHWVENHVNAQ